ncbi:hypothetical protein BHM03_00018468, partial [Ensete ventricosum]
GEISRSLDDGSGSGDGRVVLDSQLSPFFSLFFFLPRLIPLEISRRRSKSTVTGRLQVVTRRKQSQSEVPPGSGRFESVTPCSPAASTPSHAPKRLLLHNHPDTKKTRFFRKTKNPLSVITKNRIKLSYPTHLLETAHCVDRHENGDDGVRDGGGDPIRPASSDPPPQPAPREASIPESRHGGRGGDDGRNDGRGHGHGGGGGGGDHRDRRQGRTGRRGRGRRWRRLGRGGRGGRRAGASAEKRREASKEEEVEGGKIFSRTMTHGGESSDMEAMARERGFAGVTDSPDGEWTRDWEKEEQGVRWQNLLSLWDPL